MKKLAALLILAIAGLSTFAQQAQQVAPFTPVPGACGGTPALTAALNDADRDGSQSLGQSFNMTKCGLDYVWAGRHITTRSNVIGSGFPATLAIAGLPAGVVIEKAYVHWIVSYQAGSSIAPTLVFTNPNATTNNFVGTLIGSGPPKCWGEQGTRTFRADVTSAVAGNGNYVINNIIGNTTWEVDGASLIIVYSDASASFKGTFVLNDGIVTMIGGQPPYPSQTLLNFNTCANTSYISGFSISSDQQNNISPPFHQALINNISVQFPNLFWNFDYYVVPQVVTPCQTNAIFGMVPHPNDCYSVCASGFYFRVNNLPNCAVTQLQVSINSPNCGNATASATGGGQPYSYLWSNGATTDTINNAPAGVYTVTVTDNCGCLTGTASITLVPVVVNTSTVDLTCNSSGDGSATALAISGGSPPYTYSWSSVPPQNSSTATNLAAGVYTVTVTEAGGCSISLSVTINQPPAIALSFQNVTHTLCGFNNGSAEAVAAGGTGAFTYAWNTNPIQNTAIANNLAPGVYTVVATDANNCSQTATVTINPSTSPVVTPANLGSNPICITQSTQLDANVVGGTPPYAYNWTPGSGLSATNVKSPMANPIVTTTYSVDVTDVDGCTSQPQLITIDVYQPLTVVGLGNTAICNGTIVNIAANAGGGDGSYTYMWSPALPNSPGPHAVSPATSTTYNVIVTDGCGSPAATASVMVMVSPTPVVNIQPGPQTGCSPFSVQFTDGSIVSPPATINQWIWNFGDNGGSNLQNPSHTYMDGGIYSIKLKVITSDGCSAEDSVLNLIAVQQTPIASFHPDPKITTIFTPEISFYNTSSYYASSIWDFGDGNTSNIDNPSNTYPDTGKYLVTLIVTESSALQCSDTAWDYVVVNPNVAFYAPNAFTPNGDGTNEVFYPLGEGWDEGTGSYQMFIYNRWGEVIFQSNDKRFGWDGKMSTGLASPGVYVYMFIIKDLYGKEHQYLGSVALIR
jgi:gliding motility-associated-like protein